jgi:hypothetical protein
MCARYAACVVLVIVGATDALAVDIYILTGQSNSLGTTNLETPFDPGVHPADTQTDFFWSNVSTASTDPNNIVLIGDSGGILTSLQMQQGQSPSPSFWGPEFGMSRTLFDSGKSEVLVLKVSRGGGGNGFWLPSSGHMYNHLLAQIDAALVALQNAGTPLEVKGLMYLQGESNNAAEAAAADTRLQTLIDGLQAHINTNYADAASNMYSVVAEIAASASNPDRILTTTRQKALAANSSTIGFFETHDQPLKSDGIHFGRDAKLEIGRRYADAFNSQMWVENANLLAGYSANQGNLNAIPHPIAQGLTERGNDAGVTLAGINDGGIAAWRMEDDNPASEPEYRQALEGTDFQRMFDAGWLFKATAKVVSGGGQALWSISQVNDPGWGMTDTSHMNGLQLKRVNNDELEVHLWQDQKTVNLGPGSADDYHTLEFRGAARSSLFDFYIDNVLQSAGVDLRDGRGVPGFNDALMFTSEVEIPRDGEGQGLVVHWNEVSLTAVPEPGSLCWLVLGAGLLLRRTRAQALSRAAQWCICRRRARTPRAVKKTMIQVSDTSPCRLARQERASSR